MERPTKAVTPRELVVLRMVAEGLCVKEIGVALGIATSTADAHKFNGMRKLGLHSAVEITRWAIRAHVVSLCKDCPVVRGLQVQLVNGAGQVLGASDVDLGKQGEGEKA